MKTLLATLLGIPIAFPVLFGGHHQLSRVDVERALRDQMNGGRGGLITNSVHCAHLGTSDSKFTCALRGAGGSRGHAVVLVSGSTWRAQWAPLNG